MRAIRARSRDRGNRRSATAPCKQGRVRSRRERLSWERRADAVLSTWLGRYGGWAASAGPSKSREEIVHLSQPPRTVSGALPMVAQLALLAHTGDSLNCQFDFVAVRPVRIAFTHLSTLSGNRSGACRR